MGLDAAVIIAMTQTACMLLNRLPLDSILRLSDRHNCTSTCSTFAHLITMSDYYYVYGSTLCVITAERYRSAYS